MAEDRYADEDAVNAVEVAGYALEADLPTQYTDEHALAAVEAAAYAKASSLMHFVSGTVSGALGSTSNDTASTISLTVLPDQVLDHILVDLTIIDTLEFVPPSDVEPNAPGSYLTSVVCSANLIQGEEEEVLPLPQNMVASDQLLDKDAPTLDRTQLLTFALARDIPESWKGTEFVVEIQCTPVCASIVSGSTCTRSVQTSIRVRTF